MLLPALRPLVARTSIRTIRPAPFPTTYLATPSRYASQGYGGGDGNEAGENRQAQGKNPMEHKEHPGPEAPDVGQKAGGDSGSSAAEGSAHAHSDADQKRDVKSGAQPKFNTTPADENDPEVKKHNDEMEAMKQGRGAKGEDEKVGKGFWKGTGGVDRDP